MTSYTWTISTDALYTFANKVNIQTEIQYIRKMQQITPPNYIRQFADIKN